MEVDVGGPRSLGRVSRKTNEVRLRRVPGQLPRRFQGKGNVMRGESWIRERRQPNWR